MNETSFIEDPSELLKGLRLGKVGVWRWSVGSDRLGWTENLAAIHGLPETAFDGTISSFQRDIHPDDAGHVWSTIQETLRTGSDYRAVYRSAPREDGSFIWIETRGGIAGEGDATVLTGVCTNVTELVEKEERLHRQLAQQKAIAAFGRFALEEASFERVMDHAAGLACDVLDVPFVKILQFADSAEHLALKAGRGWKAGLVGSAAIGTDRNSQAGYTLASGEPVVVEDLAAETRFDGSVLFREHGVVSGMSVVIPGTGSRPFGVFGVHTDRRRRFNEADVEFLQSLSHIVANSARHRAASEQRSLLMREMAHRAGNMLQLVSTIAGQTFRPGCDVATARGAFSERLGALSRSNYLIASDGWRPTRFLSLVNETLQPFTGRFACEGRDILLPPELSFDLGLVIHELATNSAKYGTFGQSEDSVTLRWRVLDGPGASIFHFEWEDPAPAANTPGAGGGFGSRLLEGLIKSKWNGSISIRSEDHYRFGFDIPLNRIEAKAVAPAAINA